MVRNFLRQPVKALILRSYGVGNAPQNGEFIQVGGSQPARYCGGEPDAMHVG